MVIVIDCDGSIQTYLALGPNIVLLRPTICPGCGAEHSLIGHGFYPRKPLDAQHVYLIRIRRWYCTACEHTLSLLPSFLLRFRHYLLEVIQAVVVARYEEGASWRRVAERCAPHGAPSRRTVKRWGQSFANQAAAWWLAIQQTLAQQEPALPVLDAHGAGTESLDLPAAVLAASLQILAWAKTQWVELAGYGLTERLRFLWHWGYARGLNRLV